MAQNLNVTKGGGALDHLDNAAHQELIDFVRASREYKPVAERPDWRVVAAQGVVVGGLALLAWLLYMLWRALYCWNSVNWGRCDRLNEIEPVVIGLALLLAVGAALARFVVLLRAEWQLRKARAIRSAATFTRYGDPVRLDVGIQPLDAELYRMATAMEVQIAPHKLFQSVNVYSPSNTAPPQLAAPEPGLALVSDAEWRAWLSDAPHLLISGPTGAGKTTLATALLGDASDAGAHLLILDPHDAAGKWPLEAIGGGRNYAAIYDAIDALMAEMNARFQQLRAGERLFTPIVVLLDEAPAVALDDPKRWEALVGRLTSEARKVGMRFWLLGQSHLVRDLGLSSLVRRNLGLVALGPQALDLVGEEKDAQRRRQLVDLIRGQQRPAAFAYRSEVHVLDVSAVPQLAARDFTPQAWAPSVRPVEDALDAALGAMVRTDGRTDGGQHRAVELRESLVVGLKRAGRNREEIRQELQQIGLGLTNAEYGEILARHGLG